MGSLRTGNKKHNRAITKAVQAAKTAPAATTAVKKTKTA